MIDLWDILKIEMLVFPLLWLNQMQMHNNLYVDC